MTTNWGWKIIHHDIPEKKHQFSSQVALVWTKGWPRKPLLIILVSSCSLVQEAKICPMNTH